MVVRQTVLAVDFHDVNDVLVCRLFKHRDSAMVKKIRVPIYLGLHPICVSISRPCLREETHNERDISCNCVEYYPLSHVQHGTGLNGHFTQSAHETNKPLITLISENYTQITI